MTLQPNRVYRMDEIEPEESSGPCDAANELHVGPIVTGVLGTLGPGRSPRNDEYLVDRCATCGYEWGVRWLTPERREQLRRATRDGSTR